MKVYSVIVNNSLSALVVAVNDSMKNGWELQGGIHSQVLEKYTHKAAYEVLYMQSIVRDIKD